MRGLLKHRYYLANERFIGFSLKHDLSIILKKVYMLECCWNFLNINGDIMLDNDSSLMRQFLRHTATVPKGFLRYRVLQLLKKRSMSGSEIMETIEKQTDGRWKPSPGSVYPLLSWLQESNYTQEIPREKGDYIRRYKLTEEGEKFLEQQSEFRGEFHKKMDFFAPPFLSEFWLSSHPRNLEKVREPAKRLMKSIMNLGMLMDDLSDQDFEEIGEVLNKSAKVFEKIVKKLKEKNKQ